MTDEIVGLCECGAQDFSRTQLGGIICNQCGTLYWIVDDPIEPEPSENDKVQTELTGANGGAIEVVGRIERAIIKP